MYRVCYGNRLGELGFRQDIHVVHTTLRLIRVAVGAARDHIARTSKDAGPVFGLVEETHSPEC